MRAAIAAVSTTRCSGAIVVAISIDCATLRVTMMPPRFESDACAVGFDAAWAMAAERTAFASRLLDVISTARASGSCSACATRSAAIQSARPVSETITISLGPAKKSMPQSRATSALAAATQALPGPTILSTRGTLAVP